MKDVNQELEGSEFSKYPEPEDRDESTETDDAPSVFDAILKLADEQERNAKKWPSIEEQLEYWKTHDHGGNVLPSRIDANTEQYP